MGAPRILCPSEPWNFSSYIQPFWRVQGSELLGTGQNKSKILVFEWKMSATDRLSN